MEVATGRPVAIKLLLPHAGPEELERFQRECEVAERFRHPGVVPFVARDVHAGRPCLVLEFLSEGDLHDRLASGPLPIREAAALVLELARTVRAAHEFGILHRDLKPKNVLFRQGRPVLTDFGIARVADARSLTLSGELIGTPSYMAPEQALGDRHAHGPATDVYGLGAILYATLTGSPPFSAGTTIALLDKILSERPKPPRSLRPEVDPQLEAICLRALARDPAERYPTADDFAQALEPWAQDAHALGESSGSQAGPLLALAVVGLLTLVLAGLFLRDGSSLAVSPTATPSVSPTRSPVAPSATPDTTPSVQVPRLPELLRLADLEAERDLGESRRLLEDGLIAHPGLPILRTRLAILHSRGFETKKAWELLEKLKAEDFTDPRELGRFYYARGRHLESTGYADRAAVEFDRARQAAPEVSRYMAWAGRLLENPKLVDRARELDPYEPAVLVTEIVAAFQSNAPPADTRKLLQRLREVLKAHPASVRLRLYRPRLCFVSKRFEAAGIAVQKILEDLPNHPLTYFESAWISLAFTGQVTKRHLVRQGQEKALMLLERGLERFPKNTRLLRQAAFVCALTGEFVRGIDYGERLLVEFGEDVPPRTLQLLGELYRRRVRKAFDDRDVRGLDAKKALERGLYFFDRLERESGYELAVQLHAQGNRSRYDSSKTAFRIVGECIRIRDGQRGEAEERLREIEEEGGPMLSAVHYLRGVSRLDRSGLELSQESLGPGLRDLQQAVLEGHPYAKIDYVWIRSLLTLKPYLPDEAELNATQREAGSYEEKKALAKAILQGSFEDKERAFQALLAAAPELLLALRGLLDLCMKTGRIGKGLEIYEGSNEMLKNRPSIRILRGELLSRGGRLGKLPKPEEARKQAEATFSGVIEELPNLPTLHAFLFEHHCRWKEPEGAERALNGFASTLTPREVERLRERVRKLSGENR